jgi:hypothetical protein
MADEEEVLRRLEERLGQASDTAQRLMAEAAEAAARRQPEADAGPVREDEPTRPPPSGWQRPQSDRPGHTPGAELDALLGAIRSLRELVPPEVIQRLAEAVKEVLLALRALIDWYIERLERRRADPPPVEDIPIE